MSIEHVPVSIRLLGPIEVWKGEHRVQVTGWRQLSVLAVLALHVGHQVTIADLADAVWGGDQPTTVRQQVHSAVSALRRALRGLIVTREAGYGLAVPPEQIDVFAFESLVAQARKASYDGNLNLVVELLETALALWRGPALGGWQNLRGLAVGLEEQRLSALEDRIATELDLGRHGQLVAELSMLIARYPFRERLVRQLMVALYRCGRAHDALDVFRQTRQRLADETGLDPGPELAELELSVLRKDAVLGPPRASGRERTSPPSLLPPDIGTFAGRTGELAELERLVSRATSPHAPLTVVITGSPGVGKTALAVHWAHRMTARFPDGQLYENLYGYDPERPPMASADALRRLLRELAGPTAPILASGAPPAHVPTADPPAIAAPFGSLVTGRRVLIVLDNARDPEHVRPLIPAASGCVVLVTSRNQMDSLIAEGAALALRLGPLPAAEARELLRSRVGEDRAAAEPQAVDDIVALCGGNPLALAGAATRAVTHPSFRLTAFADELRPTRDRLDVLSGPEPRRNLRALFACSYRQLSDQAARLFRLLSLDAGPEISVAAAASLARLPADVARSLMAELDAANLVTEHAPGRFTQDELLCIYASELASHGDPPADPRHDDRRESGRNR
jgi:DNA-binding SARP family transcriptional activator